MALNRITKRVADEAQGSDRDTFIWDSQLKGFGLKVTRLLHLSIPHGRPGGSLSTLYDRPTRLTLDTNYRRAEAERIAILVAQGVDPVAADKERRRQTVDLAFETYATLFAASCKGDRWRRMVDRSLRLYATPALKRKALPAIRRSVIAAMLDQIPPEMLAARRNTFAAVRRMFR
jgi:hypothetical protein